MQRWRARAFRVDEPSDEPLPYPQDLLEPARRAVATGCAAHARRAPRRGRHRGRACARRKRGGSAADAAPAREGGFAADLISKSDLSSGVVGALALRRAVLGCGHALSPGHGKAIVAAYLVGTRGTARHAFSLGATATVTHTAGVFALGLVTLAALEFILPETLYPRG